MQSMFEENRVKLLNRQIRSLQQVRVIGNEIFMRRVTLLSVVWGSRITYSHLTISEAMVNPQTLKNFRICTKLSINIEIRKMFKISHRNRGILLVTRSRKVHFYSALSEI